MALEPAPTHVLAHITDSHFTASGMFHGAIPTGDRVAAGLATLESTGVPIDALVHTGDVADAGDPVAYEAARAVLEPVLARTGWPLVVAAGNHDVRAALRRHLLGQPASDAPLDSVVHIGGLRIVAVDTSIPGRVEGGLDDDQLAWLASELRQPAEFGTVLALHHPPVPVEVTALQAFHLLRQSELAAVVRESDVRAILGGHLHYATTSVFARVPVFVAPATAYSVGVLARGAGFTSIDGARAAGLLSLYADGAVGYTAVPIGAGPVVSTTDEHAFDTMGVYAPR